MTPALPIVVCISAPVTTLDDRTTRVLIMDRVPSGFDIIETYDANPVAYAANLVARMFGVAEDVVRGMPSADLLKLFNAIGQFMPAGPQPEGALLNYWDSDEDLS